MEQQPSPFDQAFGAQQQPAQQPMHPGAQAQMQPMQTGPAMPVMGQPQAQSPQPGVQAPTGPNQTVQQYMLTPEDEEELFGRERLTLTGKLFIIFGALAVIGALIAGGLWLYSMLFAPEGTQSASNTNTNAAMTNTVKPTDQDGDGLTDTDEKRYGADPKKSDTDGDGYNDGAEVKNGYNPAGPGRLQTQ